MEFPRQQYLDRLISKKNNGLIKVVTGLRRVGKSYLLFNLFRAHLLATGVPEDHVICIALDEIPNKKYRDSEALYYHVKDLIKDNDTHYVLIDEIQLVDEFYEVLNSFLHIPNIDVYVTGSNSRFLSSDIVSEFRGRSDEIRVYPLTFLEYAKGKGGDEADLIEEYLVYGGMPLCAFKTKPEEKREYLTNLYRTIYLEDIIERRGIRNADSFEELTKVLASSIGSMASPNKIADTFVSKKGEKASSTNIAKQIDYLVDSFLVSKAERYDVKGRHYIASPLKYYFADNGIRNAVLGFRQIENNHLMENAIYNELLSRGYSVDVGIVNHYCRSEKGNGDIARYEIDFVINHYSQRVYIQSAYSIETAEKLAQEERPFDLIKDGFKKVIVVYDDRVVPHQTEKGYYIVGLIDFLFTYNPEFGE